MTDVRETNPNKMLWERIFGHLRTTSIYVTFFMCIYREV